jgi:hypothetical protein
MPTVNQPQGLLGLAGLDFLPSPPPWGWSQGFLATPLTQGLKPKSLLDPAFFKFENLCCIFEA